MSIITSPHCLTSTFYAAEWKMSPVDWEWDSEAQNVGWATQLYDEGLEGTAEAQKEGMLSPLTISYTNNVLESILWLRYHHSNFYIFKRRLTGNFHQKHTEMCSVWIEIKIKMLLLLTKVVINANNCTTFMVTLFLLGCFGSVFILSSTFLVPGSFLKHISL